MEVTSRLARRTVGDLGGTVGGARQLAKQDLLRFLDDSAGPGLVAVGRAGLVAELVVRLACRRARLFAHRSPRRLVEGGQVPRGR